MNPIWFRRALHRRAVEEVFIRLKMMAGRAEGIVDVFLMYESLCKLVHGVDSL